MSRWPMVTFGEILRPNRRPYNLGPTEDADLVGMRLYGEGPFHRERKLAMQIRKKSHFVIKANDVIYNKLFAWKGTFGVVPLELDGMLVSDKFPTYEADQSKVDLNYLRWYFRYSPLWDQAKEYSKGAAALSKLTLNPPDFPKLTLPLPPLAEQRRLVERIDALAAKIEEAKRLRTAAHKETIALLNAAITSVVGNLSMNGRLGDVLIKKPRNGWSARCDGSDTGIPVLSLGAVTGFRYRQDQFKRTSEPVDPSGHYWLRDGDLLITRSNTPELVGHAAIYNGQPSPCIYPDLMMRLEVDEGRVNKRFIHYLLRSRYARDFIKGNAKGTSPTMKKISQEVVMSIPFPEDLQLEDQHDIVAMLDINQSRVDELGKQQIETASELAAMLPAILDRAFRGEL